MTTRSAMVNRRVFAVVLTGVLLSGAAACGPDSGNGDATEIVLGPARLESITNAAMIVGAADNLFESCDLDVTLQASGGGGNQIQALQSGAIDVIFPSFSAVVPAFLQGFEIVVIAGDSQGSNGMAWLTLPDSPLTSVADLEGQSVSVSAVGSNTQTMLQRILADQGVAEESVEQVVIAEVGAGLAALASGAVDAIWATEPSTTLFESSGEASVLFRADDFVQEHQLTVAAVRRDYAEANPEVIDQVLECLQKSRDVAAAETDRVARDFAASAQLDQDVAVTVLTRSIANNESTLDLSIPGMQIVLDSLVASGAVPADTTFDSLGGLFAVPEGAGVEVSGGTLP